MRVGIVGLPNAGKSSLFNALTNAGAATASYPFTTVQPNVAIVGVHDQRLKQVAAAVGATGVVFETVTFHDIAGLVRDAHTGEGLGNQFLAHIRECEAICHVVRCHDDPGVAHPDGRVDPTADIETVETELIYADLEQAQRRLERVSRQAKSQSPALISEQRWLEQVVSTLASGSPARLAPPPPGDAPHALANLQPLTAKPVLYVANIDEEAGLLVPSEVSDHARRQGAVAVAVSARLESELAELEADQAQAMRAELGMADAGIRTVIDASFDLLGLLCFFTAQAGSEAQAHAVVAGTTASEGAGKVHTEMQEGFIRAEVIGWEELVGAGGYQAARDRGALRLEGRDYVLKDGDVMLVKFRS